MTIIKIDSTHFQVYPPTEYYSNWELHFYDETQKQLVKVKIEDITKLRDKLNESSQDCAALRRVQDG